MATLEELTVKISADTSAVRSSLQNLTAQTQSATGKMGKSFNAAAFAAKGLVAAFSVRAVVNFGRDVVDAAGKLNDLSQRIGFTASTLSALQLPLEQSGSSVEALASMVARLNNKLGEAASGNESAQESFKKLGLSVNDLLALTPEKRFLAVADALGKIKDQSALAAAGQDIGLGRSFAQIIPLLREANGDLSKFVETQKEMGNALDDETIATLDRFGDAAESAFYRARNAAARALAATIEFVEYAGSTTTEERFQNVINKKMAENYAEKAKSDGFVTQASAPSAGVDLRAEYEARFGKLPNNSTGLSGGGGGKGWGDKSKSKSDPFGDTIRSLKLESEQARLQVTLYGQKNAVIERATRAAEIESRLQEQGIKLSKKQQAAMDDLLDKIEQQKSAYEDLEEVRKAQEEAEERRQRLADEFAATFESAFEDAIISGKKFSDVIKAIGDDILRTVLRTQITEPIFGANGIGALFGGGNLLGDIFSSLPSFDVGTDYVPRDMLAMVHKGEAIVPASQNKQGGGVVVNVINNSSANVRTQQSPNGNGVDLRVMIDEAVAANMSRSGSRTSQAMGAYNSRALTRR